jgi:hypothetical protein
MFVSPAQRVIKHNLTGRILLFLPVGIFLAILGVIAVDGHIETVWWIAATIIVALYVWACVAIKRNSVSIHAEGIRQEGAMSVREIRWEDVTETHYKRVPVTNQAAAHFGLIGMAIAMFANRNSSGGGGGSETIKVIGTDGSVVHISSNYRDSSLALADVRRAVEPRLLEHARRRVKEGDTVQFGRLGVSQAGVSWKGKPPIPFNAIEKVEIGGANFRIKQQGKWLDAISVSTTKVPNVFVAIDLIEELKHGGVVPKNPFTSAQQVGF